VIPTDPLIYRFYEIMQVYGMPMKAVIHEKFGDGIMSAIDFTLDIEKEEDPKGDRVKVIMCGKFLPYKSGNTIPDVFSHAPSMGTVCMSGVILKKAELVAEALVLLPPVILKN
jgi:hypothetical protein